MAWFRFSAVNNPLVRVFYENNWLTGSNSPGELGVFFSGEMKTFENVDGSVDGLVSIKFHQSWLDVVWYLASLLILFFTRFSPGVLFLVTFSFGVFFTITRLGFFWFLLFRAGLRKKGYKDKFKLVLKNKGDML